MNFENEHTFEKFVISKQEESFHKQIEQAVLDVKSEFGRQYALIIGSKKIKTNSNFAHRSPLDSRITLGYFPRSRAEDTRDAIKAARDSFKVWSKYDYKNGSRFAMQPEIY